MIFWLEFKGNLTIVAIYFYLSNPTVVSMIFWLEFEKNLPIAGIHFSIFSNRCFRDFSA